MQILFFIFFSLFSVSKRNDGLFISFMLVQKYLKVSITSGFIYLAVMIFILIRFINKTKDFIACFATLHLRLGQG